MCEGRSTGQLIEAVLIPIPDGGVDDLVALLMWDPDLIAEFVEMRFAKAYGLTRAESDVVRSLAETGDIVAYCERRNVGIEAARGHLKAAFRKTNCDSRAKLLSLLFQNWALYGGFAGRNAH
jgi:DNA-binding CsgD family transcriptional regulator